MPGFTLQELDDAYSCVSDQTQTSVHCHIGFNESRRLVEVADGIVTLDQREGLLQAARSFCRCCRSACRYTEGMQRAFQVEFVGRPKLRLSSCVTERSVMYVGMLGGGMKARIRPFVG